VRGRPGLVLEKSSDASSLLPWPIRTVSSEPLGVAARRVIWYQQHAMARTENTEELLEEVVQRILAVSDPEHIILFGSYARGEAGPDSDLDLLVLEKGVTKPRQESNRLRRALRGLLVPIDVVVATPQQADRYRNAIGLIYAPALKEGRILYERPAAA